MRKPCAHKVVDVGDPWTCKHLALGSTMPVKYCQCGLPVPNMRDLCGVTLCRAPLCSSAPGMCGIRVPKDCPTGDPRSRAAPGVGTYSALPPRLRKLRQGREGSCWRVLDSDCATLTSFLSLWEAAPCLAGWHGTLQLHHARKEGAKATAGQRLKESLQTGDSPVYARTGAQPGGRRGF